MKMSDYFLLPIDCGDIMRINEYCVVEENNDGVAPFHAAELAINNHDRLTEESARLRHELANLVYMAENNTGHEPSLSCFHLAIDEAKQLLNQLKDQNNDK